MRGSFVRLVLILLLIVLLINNVSSTSSVFVSTKNSTRLNGTSTENSTTEDVWYINETIIIKTANTTRIINESIIVGPGGKLQIINSSVEFNNSKETNLSLSVQSGGELTIKNSHIQETSPIVNLYGYSIVVAPGAKLQMKDSTFSNFGLNQTRSGITVFNEDAIFTNCSFINNYNGIGLNEISNVTIYNCSFIQNEVGIRLIDCEDISFLNCTFKNNSQSAAEIRNSGNHQSISFFNCTIGSYEIAPFKNNNGSANTTNTSNSIYSDTITLTTSILELINTSFNQENYNIDNHSSIYVKWYLRLLAVNKHDKVMSDFGITVVNNQGQLLFESKTDENGYLNWLILIEKQITLIEIINFTPFKISPPKGYTGVKEIDINITNSGEVQVMVTSKEDDGSQDFWESMNDMCFCGSIFGVIFILLLFINFQLAKRKAGVDKYKNVSYDYKKKGQKNGRVSNLGGEYITCSECGTQVTENAKFCPHCGEYFDGEEYRCPGCNARLSTSTDSCPRCGKTFEDESKLKHDKGTKGQKTHEKERKQLFCSDCGGVVFEKDTHCPGCGAMFRSKTSEAKRRTKGKKYTKKDSVKSSKGKKKSSDKNKNIKYAQKITATEEVELEKIEKDKEKKESKEKEFEEEDFENVGDTYMCSICGASVKGSSKKCPKCGTEFV